MALPLSRPLFNLDPYISESQQEAEFTLRGSNEEILIKRLHRDVAAGLMEQRMSKYQKVAMDESPYHL